MLDEGVRCDRVVGGRLGVRSNKRGRRAGGKGHSEADRRIEVRSPEVCDTDARGRRSFPKHVLRGKGWQLGACGIHVEIHERFDEPASVTKPAEYKVWKNFYDETFALVNKAIQAKDMKAFDSAYTAVIKDCNNCHEGMGYGFIKVVKLSAPADDGINYTVKSEPGDVPK